MVNHQGSSRKEPLQSNKVQHVKSSEIFSFVLIQTHKSWRHVKKKRNLRIFRNKGVQQKHKPEVRIGQHHLAEIFRFGASKRHRYSQHLDMSGLVGWRLLGDQLRNIRSEHGEKGLETWIRDGRDVTCMGGAFVVLCCSAGVFFSLFLCLLGLFTWNRSFISFNIFGCFTCGFHDVSGRLS